MMLPKKYRNLCLQYIDNLWMAWRGLGVYSDGRQVQMGIEEALIGLCVFGKYDQRLFDEALSLLSTYPGLINKNKIGYMIKKADPDSVEVFRVIVHLIASKSGDRRLQSLMARDSAQSKKVEQPFFLSLDNGPGFTGKETDPLFLKYGWTRNLFLPSKNVPELPVVASCNPWIKAKLIFGNSVRADVIINLLIGEKCTAPDLARKNGHTQKSVWNVFMDLAAAELVESTRVQNKIFYNLARRGNSLFSDLRPIRPANLWREWIQAGHYIHHLKKLPEGASPLLVKSEEARVKRKISKDL